MTDPQHSASSPRTQAPTHRLLTSALLLLLIAVSSAGRAVTTPPKHKFPPHVTQGKSHTATHHTTTSRSTRSHRTTIHSRTNHNHPSRYRSTVDPVTRLDAISAIASTLSRGSSALAFPAALAPFFAALATHEDTPDTGTVRVLQFGDSHTAADMFTGEARRVFQRQFGNGSVGFTYAGHPFAGYRIFGSQRTQSGGWATLGTHFNDLGDHLLGMGGIAVSSNRPGEFVSLDAPCASFQLDYLQQPGGGSLHLTDDDTPVADIPTDAPAMAPGTFTYPCAGDTPALNTNPDHHFVLTTTTSAPVRLLGLTALEPGVSWESIGINGAEAPLILRWDQHLFTTYLHAAAPALIVLAYGTNEAAVRYDPEAYTEAFTRLIETLHTTSPDSAILVLGPTDRATAARRRGYTPFLGTDRILDAQRDVCRTHTCTFWDQRKRMGGLGIMQQWVRAGWAQPDHTHMTGEGYRALADALLADLLSAYDQYRKTHGLPPGATTPRAVHLGQEPGAIPQAH